MPTNTIISKPSVTVIAENTTPKKVATFSVFKNHALQPQHKTPILTNVPVYYWPSLLLFIVFGIYVSVRITDQKKILKIIFSIFNLQMEKQLLREDYKLYKRVSLLLSFCFVTVFAFLLYKINNRFGLILDDSKAIVQFLFFVAVVVLMYVVKIFVTHLFSIITTNRELGNEYIFNVFLHSQVIGIVLFPMVVCLQFSSFPVEWFLYPSMIIYILFFTLRMFRGLVIAGFEQNSGFLYIILYFCALEILPLLVLVKFLANHF